jgi:hypothetical protein
VSAHQVSHPRGWLSALVARVEGFVFEPVEETIAAEPIELEPYPVVAVVSAAPRSGATTVARLLAAELASRGGGAAVVTSAAPGRRLAPPSRAAMRLSTAMGGAIEVQACGRLCIAAIDARGDDSAPIERLVCAARYLAPVVLDLPPNGAAAAGAVLADRVAVVACGSAEPALLAAVATVLGGEPLRVVNRIAAEAGWKRRADILIPDSRLGGRAAAMGTRAVGALGTAIAGLADALEVRR